MANIDFKTTKQVKDDYGWSEVTQWRYRKHEGLGYYRLCGQILYTPQQLQEFCESRRYGGNKRHQMASAA
jgi:hypothetical protein